MAQTKLRVRINNSVIARTAARDTFADVIKIIGVRQVSEIRPELVSTRLSDFPNRIQEKPHSRTRPGGEGYYIVVDFSTRKRAEYLREIASELGVKNRS